MKARGHHLGPFPSLHYQREQENRPKMELSVQLRYSTPLQQILTNVDQCKEKQKLLAFFIHYSEFLACSCSPVRYGPF